jgi:hypothetical protein
VCLKHRKNRRETIPAGVSSSKLTAVFVLFVVNTAARVRTHAQPAPLICGHRPRVRCLSAIQGIPVQVRLTAPILTHPHRGFLICRAAITKVIETVRRAPVA